MTRNELIEAIVQELYNPGREHRREIENQALRHRLAKLEYPGKKAAWDKKGEARKKLPKPKGIIRKAWRKGGDIVHSLSRPTKPSSFFIPRRSRLPRRPRSGNI